MRSALLLAALVVVQVPSVLAQSAPACDGDITVVRVSTIKPGALQTFLAAVAAHKTWYREHGFSDNIIVASRVILTDRQTGATSFSESEVVTYHVRPPRGALVRSKRDAAWDAFTKEYRDSSEIKNEYVTCMPKLVP